MCEPDLLEVRIVRTRLASSRCGARTLCWAWPQCRAKFGGIARSAGTLAGNGRSAAGRPKTAPRRDPAGAAAARFLTPRSLRKRHSCLKSEARFPVGAIWHPMFVQVGGPSVRPRDFRAGKIKHEGSFRSERGCKMQFLPKGRATHASTRFSDNLVEGFAGIANSAN